MFHLGSVSRIGHASTACKRKKSPPEPGENKSRREAVVERDEKCTLKQGITCLHYPSDSLLAYSFSLFYSVFCHLSRVDK